MIRITRRTSNEDRGLALRIRTYFWVDPSTDVCGVLMTQILPFYDAKVIELLGAFERAVYSSLDR
jgi:hypothetical protein